MVKFKKFQPIAFFRRHKVNGPINHRFDLMFFEGVIKPSQYLSYGSFVVAANCDQQCQAGSIHEGMIFSYHFTVWNTRATGYCTNG